MLNNCESVVPFVLEIKAGKNSIEIYAVDQFLKYSRVDAGNCRAKLFFSSDTVNRSRGGFLRSRESEPKKMCNESTNERSSWMQRILR